MMQAPVMILPDQQKAENGTTPYVLQTDASGFAIGAVLMQDIGKGLQPIGFISRSLNAAEQNYSTTERELLAIVHATYVWRHLLQGRQYMLQGDHKPLEALMSPGKELTRRQARWVEKLIAVGVPEMLYVPGKTIPVPDALSRRPDHPVFTPAEGLKQELSTEPNTSKCSLDPDLMTLWSLKIGEFKPPDQVNMETGMAFYRTPDAYNTGLETLCWLADAECAYTRPVRNRTSPERFTPQNPSRGTANSNNRSVCSTQKTFQSTSVNLAKSSSHFRQIMDRKCSDMRCSLSYVKEFCNQEVYRSAEYDSK